MGRGKGERRPKLTFSGEKFIRNVGEAGKIVESCEGSQQVREREGLTREGGRRIVTGLRFL